MGRLIKEKCDFLVKLPMAGQINSLNASVAAGVLMYEVVRQRQLRDKSVVDGTRFLVVDGYNIIGAWPELE